MEVGHSLEVVSRDHVAWLGGWGEALNIFALRWLQQLEPMCSTICTARPGRVLVLAPPFTSGDLEQAVLLC